jgi:tetratricopeptide (TPR) repeat protein
MGEITVSAIFHNPFYGWVVTGTGNLLRVREGLFVARTLETENLDRAYALKKKGDHYMSGGEMERAMAAYQQALEADGSLPEAHSALGILFLKEALEGGKEEPIRSLSEFNLAWKVRANFRHAYDEFVFYENFMRTLLVIHEMRSVKTTKEQSLLMLLDQSLEAGQQANRLKKESPVIHTMLLKTIRLKMGYFPGDSASSRKNRDALEDQAMKELLFLAGGPVSDSEYHAEAARLLYSLYRSSDDASPRRTGLMAELYVKPIYALSRSTLQKPSVTDQKERLQQCIHFHLTQYYRLHHGSADPYLEMIRRSIGG